MVLEQGGVVFVRLAFARVFVALEGVVLALEAHLSVIFGLKSSRKPLSFRDTSTDDSVEGVFAPTTKVEYVY